MKKEEILQSLKTERFGKSIHLFDVIDSTNTFAKSIASANDAEGTIVIAESQSAGRGRQGRVWYSELGKNLTFSVIVRPRISLKFIGLISLYAGLAVVNTIRKTTPLLPECKWPNDVLVEGKKVCGILSEAVLSQGSVSYVIIGIGLNVNQAEFPPEIRLPVTSLFLSGRRNVDRVEVLCDLLQELETTYALLGEAQHPLLIERWSAQCTMFGKETTINQDGQLITGIARSIAEDGGLMLETNDGTTKVFAGDVTLV